ncbi:MAG: AAA family ATPase [bacterium]
MYQRFFGFRKSPFELVPDPDFLFLGESHDSALANLVMGIEEGKGFVAITGPIGAGKTTILRALLRRIGRTERVCFLSQPEVDVRDLLASILDGFGAPAEGAPLVELRRRLREFLVASERPGILILDEAHLLREEALEQIRLLSNLEDDHRKLLQIVLSGQPELKTLLSTTRLMPLAQRIEMFYEIRPLSLDETRAYLERRLQIAAGSPGATFRPDAAAAIHECTGGLPRLINLLADRALVTAYVAETRVITPEIVADAFDDLGAITHAVMPGRPPRKRARGKLIRLPGFRRAPREAAEMPVEALVEASLEAPPDAPYRAEEPVETAPRGPRRSVKIFAGVSFAAVVVVAGLLVGSRFGRGDSRVAAAVPADSTAAGAPAPAAGVAPPSASSTPLGSPATTSPIAAPGAPATAPGVAAATPSAAPTSASTAAPSKPAGPADPAKAAAAPPAPQWALHVASFQRIEKAQEFATQLRGELSLPVRITPTEIESGVWYRVLIGEYSSADSARAALETMRSQRDFAFVRTVRLVPSAPTPEEGP